MRSVFFLTYSSKGGRRIYCIGVEDKRHSLAWGRQYLALLHAWEKVLSRGISAPPLSYYIECPVLHQEASLGSLRLDGTSRYFMHGTNCSHRVLLVPPSS